MTPIIDKYENECQLYAESLRSNLTDILNRLQSLLDDTRVFSTLATAQRIARSAGSCGPIGSLWESAVANASHLVALHKVLEDLKTEALLRTIEEQEV
jgi:hypothetical protein